MTQFNGRAFMLGVQHLDEASQQAFYHHGKSRDGRWALVEQIVDDAMLRLVGPNLLGEHHDSERHR